MASETATRLWVAHEAGNRPWPVLDPDPVIDFQIMEAVAAKIAKLKQKAEHEQKVAEWKESITEDDELMKLAG